MGEFDYIFFENNELQHIYKLADNPKPFHPKTTQPPLIQAVYDRVPPGEIAELLKVHGKNARGTHNITALHAAVYANNVKVVSVLLRGGADVNARDAKSCTPLHIACSMKNPELVHTLLKYRADTHLRNAHQLYPIHYAVIYGSYDIVVALLRTQGDLNLRDGFQRTPLTLAIIFGHPRLVKLLMQKRADVHAVCQVQCSPLQYAALFNQKECAEQLLKVRLYVNETDSYASTALHKAAAVNSIVELLLKAKARVNDANDLTNMTALHIACQHGHGDAVEILLKHGAKTGRKNKKGQSALHLAAMCNTDDRSLEALVKSKAEVDAKCAKGFTPLLLTILHGKCTRSKILLDAGASPVLADRDGNFPLHYAASKGHDVLVATLVQAGADVGARGRQGRTALHVGCLAGHVECCRKLVQLGSDIGARDGKGRTPLHLAAHSGNLECLELLIANRADFLQKCDLGRIPLHYACLEGKHECVSTLIRIGSDPNLQDHQGVSSLHLASCGDLNSDFIDDLLQHKADPFLLDSRGFISLSYALATGNIKGLTTLIDHIGLSSLQQPGMSAKTPLHLAAKLGNVDLLRLIMTYYTSYNLQTEDGHTPLVVAAIRGDIASMKLLLACGADLRICDKLGMRALHYAAINGRTETVNFLLELEDEKESVDVGNYKKQTAFMLAVLHQQLDCVTLLLEKGANAKLRDGNDCNALHFAVYTGNKKILNLLLEKGIDANAPEKNGKTPLILATIQRNAVIVRTLVSHMTLEGIQKVDSNGWSALHWACYKASEEIVHFLISENKYFTECSATGSGGITPLHLAALMGKARICEMMVNVFGKEILQVCDNVNRSAFYFAAFTANTDLAEFLAKNGAPINTQTLNYKLTPVMVAAIFNRGIFTQLCSKREEVNGRVDEDILGNTALIWACKQNANAAAKMILDHFKNPEYINHVNKSGRQAVHYAARNAMNRTVQRLLEMGSNVSWRDIPNVKKAMAEVEQSGGDVVSYKLILRHVTLKRLKEKEEEEEEKEKKTKEALIIVETKTKTD